MQGYFVPVPVEGRQKSLDLRLLWQNLIRFKVMIGIIFLVCVSVSALAVTVMQPVYRSEVLLAPATDDNAQGGMSALTSQFAGLASIAGVSTGAGNEKDQAIAILESQNFTEEFIRNGNLMPVLFHDEWDSEANQWKSDRPEKIPTLTDAYEVFDEDIRSINDDKRTDLVTLRIEWHDRELAAQWASQLVVQLNEHLRARDIAEAQRSIEFLNRELEKHSVVELRQGIFRMLEQQIEKIMIANVRQGYAFKVLNPAIVADVDKYVHPKKLATILSAAILGLFLAFVAVMIRIVWDRQPER